MAYEFAGAFDAAVLDTNSQLLKNTAFELVTEPGGVLATLYTNRLRSATVAQPFLSDAEGNVHLFTDPGRYRLRQAGSPPGEEITVQPDPDETEGELEAHVVAADPHPVYLTNGEHDARDHSVPAGTVVLDDLQNVTVPAPVLNDVLTFNGTNWVNAVSAGTIPPGVAGAVMFYDATGLTVASDPLSLFFNDTTNRLGVGTNAPLTKLDIRPAAGEVGLLIRTNAPPAAEALVIQDSLSVSLVVVNASPQARLEVGHPLRTTDERVRVSSDTGDLHLFSKGSSTADPILGIPFAIGMFVGAAVPFVIAQTVAQPIVFGTSGIERARISATGVVTLAGELEIDGAFNHDGTTFGAFGVTPVVQQAGGVATAGIGYGATEQGMIQRMYNGLRNLGFLN